jgi:Tfp pilus assembly PilM family ATPase
MIDMHVYSIADTPGLVLVVGVPKGDKRPAIWLAKNGEPGIILGRFYSDNHAQAAVNFLDKQVDAINRVIQFYADQHGDETR